MTVARRWALLLLAASLRGETAFVPLSEVRAGQHAIGRTVFQGDKVEEFQVEILGVLDHVGPKQSLIMARLSGGPLEKTGVMQGMSGSPVYLNGKLLGAVAIAFPFAKDPIAGIRPIEEMTGVRALPQSTRTLPVSLSDQSLAALFPQPTPIDGGRLQEIATPLTFTGMSREAVDYFTPQLRKLGMEPRQGVTGQGRPEDKSGLPRRPLEPGSMISVQLISGDMSMGADGTVTYTDGDRIYAFGHQFMALGQTEIPFARASVITLLSNLNASFKISTADEWMGTITEDRSTAVAGILGKLPSLVPVSIRIRGPLGTPVGDGASTYQLKLVRDRALTPFLLQMAVYAAIDATQRSTGASSYSIDGRVTFRDHTSPLILRNVFAGDFAVPAQVSLAVSLPLAYVLQSQFDSLQVEDISLNLNVTNKVEQVQVDQIYSSRREVRPGDRIELTAVLAGPEGTEITQKIPYTIPAGASSGPLYFTLSDGSSLNLLDYAQLSSVIPKSREHLMHIVNGVRSNNNAYVRVWRTETSFQVNGSDLPAPPASLALLLARTQARQNTGVQSSQAKLDEMKLPMGERLVSGSKTIQIEVKQ